MDGRRFDSLIRALTDARSRRAALGGLLVGTLGLLGSRSLETAAHNPLKKCKNKSGKQKKACIKKAKKHNATHTTQAPPPPLPDPCAQCAANTWCNAGLCQPKGANSAACTAGHQCESTHCVRGICCDHPCVGTNASTVGTCPGGVCTLDCDPGWGNCSGDRRDGCVWPLNTEAHCGSCHSNCLVWCGPGVHVCNGVSCECSP